MLTLDTNVLIRVLVDDPSGMAQCHAVRQQLAGETTAYIPQVVLAETTWTLATTFAFGKPELLTALRHLRDNTRYIFQNPAAVTQAIADYETGHADFADYLILAESRAAGHVLLTLDKRLLKSPDTQRVPPLRK